MIGEIKHFDDERQEGIIQDDKGSEHVFDLVGWRGRGLPTAGVAVDFEVRDTRAVQVFNARVKQQKARLVVSMPPDMPTAVQGSTGAGGQKAETGASHGNPHRGNAGKAVTRKRWWFAGLAIVVLILAGLWI